MVIWGWNINFSPVATSSETIEVNSFLHKQLHGVLEFSGNEVRLNSGKPSFKEQR